MLLDTVIIGAAGRKVDVDPLMKELENIRVGLSCIACVVLGFTVVWFGRLFGFWL